jgi:AcrR family transcriptional regulator
MAAKKRATGGGKARAASEPRRRRSPEEAKELLLDAAERLFSERGPDAVGLRDVGRDAGVSHGLITHYFKTYEGLVEAVFNRRTARIAGTVVTRFVEMGSKPSSEALIDLMLGIVSEPIHLRLVAWAMLTGRAQQPDFVAGRQQGLRPIAEAIYAAATGEAERSGTRAPSRDDVDYALLLAIGAAYGWGLGKAPFLAALGRKTTARSDQEVMARLKTMVRALITPRE